MLRDYDVVKYASVTQAFYQFIWDLLREISPSHSKAISFEEFADLLSWDFTIEFFSECVNRGIVPELYVKILVSRTRRLSRVVKVLKKVIKKDHILRWLKMPNKALGDQSPKELMCSNEGTAKILDLIGQIESGSFL